MLNSVHSVLMRFKEDYVVAQGDIKKMFYQVRIANDEQFMQLWLWKFPEDADIRTFLMTRLVMGNIYSPSLSIVAIHDTAKLGDKRTRYPVAYQTLKRNLYMDNVCRGAPDVDSIKKDIQELELVPAIGGFHYKD